MDFLSINLVLLLINCRFVAHLTMFKLNPAAGSLEQPSLFFFTVRLFLRGTCPKMLVVIRMRLWRRNAMAAHPWRILTCSWHLFLNGGGLVCRTLNCCTGAQTNLHSMHRHWACCVHNQMNKSTAKKEAQRSL